jgi:stearoyl-CoA desaturase (Delta-9 desaturase)
VHNDTTALLDSHSVMIETHDFQPQSRTPDLRSSLTVRMVTASVILVPLLALVAIPFCIWGWGFSWIDLGLLVGMYLITAFGITIGYHRLFTHRSFETFGWIKALYGIMGSMAVQGTLFTWVADHRKHHQHSDDDGDPHSPHLNGRGVWGVIKGAWHSHVGWLFEKGIENHERFVKDLSKSKSLTMVDRLFPVWVLVGMLIPAIIGGLLKMSWVGVLTGFVWGGIVRMFLVHHVTWSVNSACHLWGARPYASGDQSRNNPIFGILAMGEGWHNAHHAFPTSARHGLKWWQFDVSYYVIWLMQKCRLAWAVRIPSEEVIARASQV